MYAFVLLLFCWQLTVAVPELVPVLLGISAVFWIAVVPLVAPLQVDAGRQ
jgi:hypothetical protein